MLFLKAQHIRLEDELCIYVADKTGIPKNTKPVWDWFGTENNRRWESSIAITGNTRQQLLMKNGARPAFIGAN